jgi:hypothetical protein
MWIVSQQTLNKSNNCSDQYNTIFHKSIGKTTLWGVRINCSNALCIACIKMSFPINDKCIPSLSNNDGCLSSKSE